LRLSVGATLCGRPKTTIGKWQSTIRISSTQRGEDKGEGEINTLPIADCRLSVEKKQKLDSCWNLPLIYSCPLPINIKKQVYR